MQLATEVGRLNASFDALAAEIRTSLNHHRLELDRQDEARRDLEARIEPRIRKLERWQWRVAGAMALATGVAGAAASVLSYAILS